MRVILVSASGAAGAFGVDFGYKHLTKSESALPFSPVALIATGVSIFFIACLFLSLLWVILLLADNYIADSKRRETVFFRLFNTLVEAFVRIFDRSEKSTPSDPHAKPDNSGWKVATGFSVTIAVILLALWITDYRVERERPAPPRPCPVAQELRNIEESLAGVSKQIGNQTGSMGKIADDLNDAASSAETWARGDLEARNRQTDVLRNDIVPQLASINRNLKDLTAAVFEGREVTVAPCPPDTTGPRMISDALAEHERAVSATLDRMNSRIAGIERCQQCNWDRRLAVEKRGLLHRTWDFFDGIQPPTPPCQCGGDK